MESVVIDTPAGQIVLKMKHDAAPVTCKYVTDLVQSGLYDGTSSYRSDCVIQMGTCGTSKQAPVDLQVNETNAHVKISNTRGTAATAHWDVPDWQSRILRKPRYQRTLGHCKTMAGVVPLQWWKMRHPSLL